MSIFPENPNKKELLKAINYYNKDEIKTLYRLLIEFDNNKYTSNLKEFLFKYYKGEK